MRKEILFIAAWLFVSIGMQAASSSQEVVRQLIKNAHGGVEVHNINGETSYSGYVGTGYMFYFYKERAYIRPDINLKYGKYRYKSGYDVKTGSFAIPVTVGYHVVQQRDVRMTVFGGGRYEQIVYSENRSYMREINTAQVGVTAGTAINLLNKFGVNVSYYYGLTSLYKDGSGRMSSFSFAFTF